MVSPSRPISIGASEVTSNVGVAHDESPLKRSGWPDARAARNAAASARLVSTNATTPSWWVSIRGRLPKPPNVVPYGLLEIWMMWAPWCSTPSAPVNRRSNGSLSGPNTWGRVARVVSTFASRYAVGAHDRGVEAERDVVHEHVAVDVGEVHRPLHGLSVGVERADDVVTVEAEVARQVVPRARRHDDHGQSHLDRHGADHRLGSVASGHAEDVHAAGGHVPDHLEPVLARLQHHRSDATLRALVHEMEAFRLTTPGLEVHEQDASGGGRYRRALGLALLERADRGAHRVLREGDGDERARRCVRRPRGRGSPLR